MSIAQVSRTKNRQIRLQEGVPERRYLPELHGVRGLALAGVVLFHIFGAGRVSGGIDIFLAVSGFLFTGMLLREATSTGGRIDPVKYYGRLFRRIFIPAALVATVTLLIGLAVSPAAQHRQLWAEARASLLYFENLELINSQLGYGAAGPETSPFQHFWSLSVQGQFYIIWPALAILAVLLAKRLRTSAATMMGLIIGLVFVASFVYAIYVGNYNQDEAYLMTTTRAWQLAFGGLLALAGGCLRLPDPLRAPAGWLGLALIISTGFVLDGAQLFPGPWALYPLTGLTLVLVSAGPRGGHYDPKHTATRFLSNKPLAWIGDHAYGLYLWHWPILIFYMEFRDREAVGLRGGLVILGITLALAVLMSRYIEQPLQRLTHHTSTGHTRSVNKTTVAIGMCLVLVTGLATTALAPKPADLDASYQDLDPELYPGAAQAFMSEPAPPAAPFPAPEDAGDFKQEYLDRGCAQGMGEKPGSDQITVCEDEHAPANPAATVVLAGGSHAGHYEAAFKALARKYNWEVLVVIKSGCLFGWEEHPEQTMCGKWNENFVDWLKQNEVDLVVTPGSRQDDTHHTEYIVDAAPNWWQKISATGTELLLIRGTPRNDESIPSCLSEERSPQECGPSKMRFLESDPLLEVELPANVYPIDVTPYVCPKIHDQEAQNCEAVVGNITVWFDPHHFTTPFSRSLAPGFEAEMKKVVPHLLR